MQAVVLAGGECDTELARVTGAKLRAEIRVGERTLLERAIAAAAPIAEPIQVGGEPLVERHAPGGATFLQSLRNGLDRARDEEILIVTADMPDVNRDALGDFVGLADRSLALNYAIVSSDLMTRDYPGMDRTYLRIREGRFTGGNVALARRDALEAAMPQIESAYANRKRPMALAALVGIGTLFRVAVGAAVPSSLPLARLESGVGRMLGAKVAAVVTSRTELACDIDSATQYQAYLALQKIARTADDC